MQAQVNVHVVEALYVNTHCVLIHILDVTMLEKVLLFSHNCD